MTKRANIIALTAGLIALLVAAFWLYWRQVDRQYAAGKELIFRIESFSINLFPPTMAEINSRRIGTLLNEPLIRIREDGTYRPGIAASWSNDGLVWRFKIAQGPKFSDGRPVTVDDAIASLCRTMQPGTSWAWSLSSIAQTKEGDAVRCDGLSGSGDELVVRQAVNAPWLGQALAGPAGWILPRDADSRAGYGVVPGAGRYKVQEIVPDSHVLLTPVDPAAGLANVRFRYLADDSQAAALMRSGVLSSLYLQSPLLKSAVTSPGGSSFSLESRRFDRVRVLILNETRLRMRGLTATEIRTFRDALDTMVDRGRLAEISEGIAMPDNTPLPIFGTSRRSAPSAAALRTVPTANLTVLSEPDAFSDQIAAALPTQVGAVQLTYRGIEKGALLGALVKGDYDIACLVLEATMHSPKFWASFFEPQGAFVAFGMPIPGVEAIDFSKGEAVAQLDDLLTRESNWILLFRENRIDAMSKSISGIAFTPSGQDDLSEVKLN